MYTVGSKLPGRNDPYFLTEGPDGSDRGMNPYYHGRGIFRFDPKRHFVYTGDRMAEGFVTQYSGDLCERTEDVWQWLFAQRRH